MGELLAHLATTPAGDYMHPFWLDKFALSRFKETGASAPQVDLFRNRANE